MKSWNFQLSGSSKKCKVNRRLLANQGDRIAERVHYECVTHASVSVRETLRIYRPSRVLGAWYLVLSSGNLSGIGSSKSSVTSYLCLVASASPARSSKFQVQGLTFNAQYSKTSQVRGSSPWKSSRLTLAATGSWVEEETGIEVSNGFTDHLTAAFAGTPPVGWIVISGRHGNYADPDLRPHGFLVKEAGAAGMGPG